MSTSATYHVGDREVVETMSQAARDMASLGPLTFDPRLARETATAGRAASALADVVNRTRTLIQKGDSTLREFTRQPRRTSYEEWASAFRAFADDYSNRVNGLSDQVDQALADYEAAVEAALVPRRPDPATETLIRQDLQAHLHGADTARGLDQVLADFAERGDDEAAVLAGDWGRTTVRLTLEADTEAVDGALHEVFVRLAPDRGRTALAEAASRQAGRGLPAVERHVGIVTWALEAELAEVLREAPPAPVA